MAFFFYNGFGHDFKLLGSGFFRRGPVGVVMAVFPFLFFLDFWWGRRHPVFMLVVKSIVVVGFFGSICRGLGYSWSCVAVVMPMTLGFFHRCRCRGRHPMFMLMHKPIIIVVFFRSLGLCSSAPDAQCLRKCVYSPFWPFIPRFSDLFIRTGFCPTSKKRAEPSDRFFYRLSCMLLRSFRTKRFHCFQKCTWRSFLWSCSFLLNRNYRGLYFSRILIMVLPRRGSELSP